MTDRLGLVWSPFTTSGHEKERVYSYNPEPARPLKWRDRDAHTHAHAHAHAHTPQAGRQGSCMRVCPGCGLVQCAAGPRRRRTYEQLCRCKTSRRTSPDHQAVIHQHHHQPSLTTTSIVITLQLRVG